MTKYTIACLDVFAPAVREVVLSVTPPEFEFRFAESYDDAQQLELAMNSDFLLVGTAPVTAAMLEKAKRVKFIQKWGIGVDKIDLVAAERLGVPVAITGGANAGPVAELAVGLMLAVYRRIPFADRKTREGVWLKTEMRSWCYQLDGKTIGILGFGQIGKMVAHRLRGFDAKILYYDIVRPGRAVERGLHATYVPFDELVTRSDILTVHVPLTDLTRSMVSRQAIAKMKDGAVIINTARGGIVDEDALADAIESGKLRGAGIDVFDVEPLDPSSRLTKLERVVLTPHNGGGVFDNVGNVAEHALGNLQKFLRGDELAPADVIVPVRPRA